ncbi:MAG: hypothetical protein WC162_10355 [Sphaerochaetaceae bacterium]|nr:hypothetical protein [Sphaerochaetaceae bacterium]
MFIENEKIRIECIPEHGGKLSSIFDKEKQIEFLFQNPKGSYKKATVGSDFSKFEASGFDDGFPSINPGIVKVGEKLIEYPDHGEVWSTAMEIEDDNALVLSFHSKILPYYFKKKIKIKEKSCIIDYSITNTGNVAFPAFYTFHCLVSCKKNMELLLPASTKKVEILASSRFLKLEETNYPITEQGIDLSKPFLLKNGGDEMFNFKGKLAEGKVGYHFPEEKTNFLLNFDRKQLPYLGFWNTQGGYRGDFNVALEMSNGNHGSIEKAQMNNACPIIEPGSKMEFSLGFELSDF